MPKVSVECRDRWLLWLSGMRPEFCLLRNGNSIIVGFTTSNNSDLEITDATHK